MTKIIFRQLERFKKLPEIIAKYAARLKKTMGEGANVFSRQQQEEAAIYADKKKVIFSHNEMGNKFQTLTYNFVNGPLLARLSREEASRYLLYHLLVGSTPEPKQTTLFDFEGELSIRKLIDDFLADNNINYPEIVEREDTAMSTTEQEGKMRQESNALLNSIEKGEWGVVTDIDAFVAWLHETNDKDVQVALELAGYLELCTPEGMTFLKKEFPQS